MGQELTGRDKIIQDYHDSVEPLLTYLPWIRQHAGESAIKIYGEQGIAEHSLSFPVFDPTLMQFVREAGKSSLMDRNYRYVYSRNRLCSHDDERKLIARANWRTWDHLKGIFSWYILGGRVKAAVWSEGMREDIYGLVLEKMRDIAVSLENAKQADPFQNLADTDQSGENADGE